MSGIGTGSTTDHMVALLRLFDNPDAYKEKMKEYTETEQKAREAVAEQEEANREAAAKLDEAKALAEQGAYELTKAKELQAELAGRSTSLDEREAKVKAKEKELGDQDRELAQYKARAYQEIEQQRMIIKQRADSIISQELELQTRMTEVDRLHHQLEEKLQRIRAIAS